MRDPEAPNGETRTITFLDHVAHAAILARLALGCSNKGSDVPTQPDVIRGFVFFDLGANSRYSNAVRRKLGERLGSDAISQHNVIDLTFTRMPFSKSTFHNLVALTNSSTGRRVSALNITQPNSPTAMHG